MTSEDRLEPARPDVEGRPSYAPRLPWKWIVLGLGGAAILFGSYFTREQSKEAALRSEIISAYEQRIEPAAARYREFRAKLEGLIIEAAAHPPPRHVDPRLKIAALHSGEGLYLRLRAEDARTEEGIARGASAMFPDAITRCLGIAPASGRGLWEGGSFLMPEWLASVRNADGMMRLRVLDDELARRASRDLPSLISMLGAEYFLLVLEHGESRRTGPVDVFLWDLEGGERVLSLRTEANGFLLPVRIAMPGAERSAAPPRTDSGGAVDCSIAANIKELTGEPAMRFGSALPIAPDGVALAPANENAPAPTNSPAPASSPAPAPAKAPAPSE